MNGASRAVIVGAGFIGSEVAAVCKTAGLEVTVLEIQSQPMAHILGERRWAPSTPIFTLHAASTSGSAKAYPKSEAMPALSRSSPTRATQSTVISS